MFYTGVHGGWGWTQTSGCSRPPPDRLPRSADCVSTSPRRPAASPPTTPLLARPPPPRTTSGVPGAMGRRAGPMGRPSVLLRRGHRDPGMASRAPTHPRSPVIDTLFPALGAGPPVTPLSPRQDHRDAAENPPIESPFTRGQGTSGPGETWPRFLPAPGAGWGRLGLGNRPAEGDGDAVRSPLFFGCPRSVSVVASAVLAPAVGVRRYRFRCGVGPGVLGCGR